MVCQPLELPEKMRQVLHKSTIAMLPDSLPLERAETTPDFSHFMHRLISFAHLYTFIATHVHLDDHDPRSDTSIPA